MNKNNISTKISDNKLWFKTSFIALFTFFSIMTVPNMALALEATTPSSVVLSVGSTTPVLVVTNVLIPVSGATDTTGVVRGWVSGTANTIKFTVTDAGSSTSAITIDGNSYVSGADYTITATGTLNVIATTTEISNTDAVRTFTITVLEAVQTAPVSLGASGNFVILSKSGISTTGVTSITGDIGVSPASQTAITGFSETMDSTNIFSTSAYIVGGGKLYASDYSSPTPSNLSTAVTDMHTAITNANGRAISNTNLTGIAASQCVTGTCDLSGLTLAPGVYTFTGPGNVIITGDVTLFGSANDVWIFIIPGTLSINSGMKVLLTGGAVSSNVFWSVAGATTLGTVSTFEGNILEAGSVIALQTGATLNGRALSEFAVTIDASTITLPLSSASSTKAFSTLGFSSGTGIINESSSTISINVPFGTNLTNLVAIWTTTGAGVTISGTPQVSSTTPNNFTSPVTYRVTASNGSVHDYVVTVNVLSTTQLSPSSGAATISTSTPEVVLTDVTSTTTLTISSDVTNPTINVSAFISGGTGTLPAVNISSANANNVTIAIPASTIVTSASTTWNGIIGAPVNTTVTLPVESGQTKTLSTAIEVGVSGETLTFSKAVRLLLPNQAGKRAGYIATSTFTEITATCASDDQTTGDALIAGGECKIDVGSDLVIWTKHFTSFATYTQTTNPVAAPVTYGGGGWFSGGSFQTYFNPNTVTVVTPVVTTPSIQTTQVKPKGKVLGVSVYNFTKDLRMGMGGNDVKELQKLLITDGFLKISAPTDYFGQLTRSALIKWQVKNKLPSTGYYGPMTRGLINKMNTK